MEKAIFAIIMKYNRMFLKEFDFWAIVDNQTHQFLVQPIKTFAALIKITGAIETFSHNENKYSLNINHRYDLYSPVFIANIANSIVDEKLQNFSGKEIMEEAVKLMKEFTAGFNKTSHNCQLFVKNLFVDAGILLDKAS